MLSLIVVIAVLPAALAKFAFPIDQVAGQTSGTVNWDITYRMANLAGPIAVCHNTGLNGQRSGTVDQAIATAGAAEALLSTTEYTAAGWYFWTKSSGWDAESVSEDITAIWGEASSLISQMDSGSQSYGCSVEPYCDPAIMNTNPCSAEAPDGRCTLVVCMYDQTPPSGEVGKTKAKSRRDATNPLNMPMLDGVPSSKVKAYTLRDSYPRNATEYYKHLAQPNVKLLTTGNKDQEDLSKAILEHFQCDPFIDGKANLESIPWDSAPGYKDRNIDYMRKRMQFKPIFERVFVIDENEISDEEKPTYREDSVVRMLQSVHRYAAFLRMRVERVGCAYVPQCKASYGEFPLAVMVCITVQAYNGPTPPPRKTTLAPVPTVAPVVTVTDAPTPQPAQQPVPTVPELPTLPSVTPVPEPEAVVPEEDVNTSDEVTDMENQKKMKV